MECINFIQFFLQAHEKAIRFDSEEFGVEGSGVVGAEDEWFSWDQSAERQSSQDSTTKDSGIDTCSNFTSSEDSNRELVHTKVFIKIDYINYAID